MQKRALSLVEVLVSVVILSLLMTGLTNLFVSGKRYILHSRSRMAGGELGRLFIDPLQMAVRQDTWLDPANALAQGVWYCDNDPAHIGLQHPNCLPEAERTLNGIRYDIRYSINRDQPIALLNRVAVDVNWQERSP